MTVTRGTTICIIIPGYELTSGLSGTRGVSPNITTVNMTNSVVAADSLMKYTCVYVNSVSFEASTIQTIPVKLTPNN